MAGNIVESLNSQGVLEAVVRFCGGVFAALNLRGSCRAARTLIPPPTHCGDEEDLLLRAAYSGDVQSCVYAISRGACRLYAAADVAASRGHFGAFSLVYKKYCNSAHWDAPMLGTNYSLIMAAIRGGDRRVFDALIAEIANDRQAVNFVFSAVGHNGHPRAGTAFLKDMIDRQWKPGEISFELRYTWLVQYYVAGFVGPLSPERLPPFSGEEDDEMAVTDMDAYGSMLEVFRYRTIPPTQWDVALCGAAAVGSKERCRQAMDLGARNVDAMLLSALYAKNLEMCKFAVQCGASVTDLHRVAAAVEGFPPEIMEWLLTAPKKKLTDQVQPITDSVVVGNAAPSSMNILCAKNCKSTDAVLCSASRLDKIPQAGAFGNVQSDYLFAWGCRCNNYQVCKIAVNRGLGTPRNAFYCALKACSIPLLKLVIAKYGKSVVDSYSHIPSTHSLYQQENYSYQKKLVKFCAQFGVEEEWPMWKT